MEYPWLNAGLLLVQCLACACQTDSALLILSHAATTMYMLGTESHLLPCEECSTAHAELVSLSLLRRRIEVYIELSSLRENPDA